MSKKNENKWRQVGNYLLGIEKNATGSFLVCKTVAGNWSVRWRDDTIMFGLMLSIVRNEAAEEYLHALITLMFTASSYPHDLVALMNKTELPVIQGFTKLIAEQNDYEASLKPQPTEEENQESLKEMKMIAEMEKQLSEMSEEEEKEKTDGDETADKPAD